MNESVDTREGPEVEISRLFPKCRPRSTPSSPNNPPTTPIPGTFSTSLSSSNTASYPQNISIHSGFDYSASQVKNSLVQGTLNKRSRMNPKSITYTTDNIPNRAYINPTGIITASSNVCEATNISNNAVHNQVSSLNVKPIHPSVISHHNFNCASESDDNDNFNHSHQTVEEVARMQESSSSNSSSSNSSSSSTSSGSNSSSRMSVDTASSNCSPGGGGIQTTMGSGSMNDSADASVVSGYHEPDHSRSSVLDSSYEDAPMPQTRREHFRLRDSRIEAAGGREVYSQSRSRMHHHRHRGNASHVTVHHNSILQNQQHLKQQHLVQLQQQQLVSRSIDSTIQNEQHLQQGLPLDNSSASSSCSRTSRESGLPPDSPLVYETRFPGSSEVVFDDIGEWNGGLTVRGMDDQTNASSTPTSGPDSESPEVSPTRVTKIGNVPIADYEGSPRRYGPRSAGVRFSPRRGHSLRPRPGFPRRVSSYPHEDLKSAEKKNMLIEVEQVAQKDQWIVPKSGNNSCTEIESRESPVPPIISISTLTSVYASTIDEIASATTTTTSTTAANKTTASLDSDMIYDYEVSETQKVLQEFFQDSRVSRTPPQAFYDLEYHLKRHHGNSYVGQRLAEEYEGDVSSHLKDSSQPSTEGSGSDSIINSHNTVDSETEQKSSNAQEVLVVGEDGELREGDQVVKFNDVEVRNRVPSVHQCPSFNNRHSIKSKILRHEKHSHVIPTALTPPSSSPSHSALDISSHISSSQHFQSLRCFVASPNISKKLIKLSPLSPTSGDFVSMTAAIKSSSNNDDGLTNLVACREKLVESQNIASSISHASSHFPSLNKSSEVLEEDFLNLSICSGNQGICCDDRVSELCINSKNVDNLFDIASYSRETTHEQIDIEEVDDDDDDEDDLVDLDQDEEELKVSLTVDEETDCDEPGALVTETVNNLLDLPIDCPIPNDYCFSKTVTSLTRSLNQCEVFPDDHEDGDRVPLLVSSPVSGLDSSGLEIYISEAGHQVTELAHLTSLNDMIVGASHFLL